METVSTRVHEDTVEDIKKYQEEHDIDSKSETVRRLIRAGLEEDTARDRALIQGITISTLIIAFLAFTSVGNVDPIYGIGAILAFLATIYYTKYSLSLPPIFTD